MTSLSTETLLYQLVKATFRGYCTKYQSQNDEAKERMELTNCKVGRHRARQVEVRQFLWYAQRPTNMTYYRTQGTAVSGAQVHSEIQI